MMPQALPIAQLGQPVLRRRAEEVPLGEVASTEFQTLLADMRETLLQSGGVGLAGPQVFASRRVFLAILEPIEDRNTLPPPQVIINPTLILASQEWISGWEGCLSFEELVVRVPRVQAVRLEFFDEHAQAKSVLLTDFAARVVQHEFDHLDGVLTLDRARSTLEIVKASELEDFLEGRE